MINLDFFIMIESKNDKKLLFDSMFIDLKRIIPFLIIFSFIYRIILIP